LRAHLVGGGNHQEAFFEEELVVHGRLPALVIDRRLEMDQAPAAPAPAPPAPGAKKKDKA